MARHGRAARAYEQRTQADDHAITETEAGRTLSGAIENQQLVLDDHGFGHDGTHSAGTGEAGDGRQQMHNKEGQIAPHDPSKISKSSETFANWQFAMHR